jgi:ribosomal protein S18 acetylase RimI-like enzyme
MVEPTCWRQGIASGLLAKVIHQSRVAGRNRLTLYTRKENNDNAQTFYKHQGFTLTGRTKENPEYGPQAEYEFTL